MNRYCVGPTMAVDWGDEGPPPAVRRAMMRRVLSYFGLCRRPGGCLRRASGRPQADLRRGRRYRPTPGPAPSRRLRSLMIKKRGRNLRAGQARQWNEDWFNGLGLYRLRGTIRYPKTA